MSETYQLRLQLIEIARRDRGKVEETRNRAEWIKKLWPATSTPEFYKIGNRDYPNGDPPYCAAGVAYCVREWLRIEAVRKALGLADMEHAEKWRCKSASAFGWLEWAGEHGVQELPSNAVLHTGDLVVYNYRHIEFVTNDDNTTTGPFVAIGFNTNALGSRDGEGCFEKPRSRMAVKRFIRFLK